MDDQPGIDLDMHNVIVNASFEMLSAVQRVLRPTPMPGRRHYMFNLRDFVNCFNVSLSNFINNSSTKLNTLTFHPLEVVTATHNFKWVKITKFFTL